MIDAKYLQLDNLVYYSVNGEPKHIGRITGLYNTADEKNKGIIDYHYPLIFGEPIPLTPDLILKCSFEKSEKHSDNDYSVYVLDDLYLQFEWRRKGNGFIPAVTNYEDELETFGIAIKYIHQLQNFNYALTQKELKINL